MVENVGGGIVNGEPETRYSALRRLIPNIVRRSLSHLVKRGRGTVPHASEQSPAAIETRRILTDDEAGSISSLLATEGSHIVDVEKFKDLVNGFAESDLLNNPERVVGEFMACSPHIKALYEADPQLQRPTTVERHTIAVLSIFKQYYRRFFSGNPEALKILGLALLLGDSGKTLCIKETGDNRQQTIYNLRITNKVLEALDASTIADDAKEVVRLLVGKNIIGSALQGRFDQNEFDELRRKWPQRFAEYFDRFNDAYFSSDAGAHAKHALPYSDVREEDEENVHTLTYLFEPPAGNRLTLAPPYSRVAATLFPDGVAAGDLMRQIVQPEYEHTYTEKPAKLGGTWSARFVPWDTFDGRQQNEINKIKAGLERYTRETRVPLTALVTERGVTLVRAPSQRYETPPEERYIQAESEIVEMLGWKKAEETARNGKRVDIRACVGLEKGSMPDEQRRGKKYKTDLRRRTAEAMAFLLTQCRDSLVGTKPARLISTGPTDDARFLIHNKPVMLIDAEIPDVDSNSTIDRIKQLAQILGQEEGFFVQDYRGDGETTAYYREEELKEGISLPRKVTVVRHAHWKKAGKSLLPSDKDYKVGLSRRGKREAIKLGEALRKMMPTPPDFVLTSSYRRTSDTANIAAAVAWPGFNVQIIEDDRLVEQNKGTDPGDYYEDDNLPYRKYKGGETLRQAGARMLSVLEEEKYNGKNILIIGHARTILEQRRLFSRRDYPSLRDQILPGGIHSIMIGNCQMDTYERTIDPETGELPLLFTEMTTTETLGRNPRSSGVIRIVQN